MLSLAPESHTGTGDGSHTESAPVAWGPRIAPNHAGNPRGGG